MLSLAGDAANGSWYDLVLAALNVVQTVALAYLAADRHQTIAARRQGRGTSHDDRPPPAAS